MSYVESESMKVVKTDRSSICLSKERSKKGLTEVHEGYDNEYRTSIVMKLFNKPKCKKSKEAKVIRQKIRNVIQIDHPFICHLYYILESEKSISLVKEKASNGNLYTLMRKFGKIPEDHVRIIMSELLNVIGFLHQNHSFIHGNMDPSHILLDKYYHIKLIGIN